MLLKVAVSVLGLSRPSEGHPVVDFGCHLSVGFRQKLNNATIKKTQQPITTLKIREGLCVVSSGNAILVDPSALKAHLVGMPKTSKINSSNTSSFGIVAHNGETKHTGLLLPSKWQRTTMPSIIYMVYTVYTWSPIIKTVDGLKQGHSCESGR